MPQVPARDWIENPPLSTAEVTALAAKVAPRYRVAVLIAAYTGLRQGEILGLTTRRIDTEGRRLRVVQQLQNRELTDRLKTKRSKRIVPADDVVFDAIGAHTAKWAPGPWDLLITNRLGLPVQRNSFGDCWREAVTEAGVAEGTRFHELRHFYASMLIKGRVDSKVVQERLGHSTHGETMDTYVGLFPDDMNDAGRGVMDEAFAPARRLRAV